MTAAGWHRHDVLGLAVALSAAACGGGARSTPAPAPAQAPAPTPTPTAPPVDLADAARAEPPPLDAPAWRALDVTAVPCVNGAAHDDCLDVALPAAGFLLVAGHSPHDRGCVDLDRGVLEATIGSGVVDLRMTLPGAGGTAGLCRALAVLRGRGVVGPLAAGRWRLRPEDDRPGGESPYAPLHLGEVRFAPAP